MADSKTYRAITEVHITQTPGKVGDRSKGIAPTPPKAIIIPAKKTFEIDPESDTCKELLAAKAIVLDDSDEKSSPVKVSSGKKPASKPASKPETKPETKGGSGDGSEMV